MQALAFSGGKDSMACLHLMRTQLDCAIYIDTGYSYPETERLVDYAATLLPLHRIQSNRAAQQEREGWPSDVVPINWTRQGQEITGQKPIMIQSYLACCWDNISWPLLQAATRLGVTTLVCGQRQEETHKSTIRHYGQVDGVRRVHPIADWTSEQVLTFLEQHMDVPDHYRTVRHSSLDCFDCTGFAQESQDRLDWTATRYPAYAQQYHLRASAIQSALQDAMQDVSHERVRV